ncbi:hypothetical protein PHAVU_010G135200, partial [Phaseolus vulgaris]
LEINLNNIYVLLYTLIISNFVILFSSTFFKLIGVPYGLCFQQLQDLSNQVHVDGNGVIDFDEFKKIWNSACPNHVLENLNGCMEDVNTELEQQEAIGFMIKNAMLYPREVEKGLWPEDYSEGRKTKTIKCLLSPSINHQGKTKRNHQFILLHAGPFHDRGTPSKTPNKTRNQQRRRRPTLSIFTTITIVIHITIFTILYMHRIG